MSTKQTMKKRQKLSHEILGLLGVSFAISLFLFEFLSLTADSIVSTYCDRHDLVLTYAQTVDMELWISSISLVTAVLFFVILFLFLLGQKISYIQNITKGVEALQENQMDFVMELEGNNELTQLAETINYLSAAQKEIKQKEKKLNKEKDALIRTLSHDIRTPLTSIMSYSEYLSSQEDLDSDEQKRYYLLIQKKAGQIKELTDILLDGTKRNLEYFENGKLLMEQLISEMEESLEDDFFFSADLTGCTSFSGTFDLQELRRIFDNLTSNIEKYADSEKPVTLSIALKERQLFIQQKNLKRLKLSSTESYQIGLNSIRRIAHNYGGTVEVQEDANSFTITIILSIS